MATASGFQGWSTESLKVAIREWEYRILAEGRDDKGILDEMCRELGTREEC